MGQTDHSKEISEVWAEIYVANQPYSVKINILASLSSMAQRCFKVTCSENLLIQTTHGRHSYGKIFKKTHRAEIPEIL